MTFTHFLAVASVCALGVNAHSLLVCTDLNNADQSCAGYARNIVTYTPRGSDGVVINPIRRSSAPCSENFKTLKSSSYTTQHPMARARPGQTMTLAWPANNHQRAGPGVPDSNNAGDEDVFIYAAGRDNPQPPASLTDGPPAFTLTYSNCLAQGRFDETLTAGSAGDTYLCHGDITMPTTPGRYTFVWEWSLGEPTPYTSCWDVDVSDDAPGGTGGTPSDGPTGNPPAGPTARPVPPGACYDSDPNWSDSDGDGCKTYENGDWCVAGTYGPNWIQGKTFATYAVNGEHAGTMCCVCGGGNRGFRTGEFEGVDTCPDGTTVEDAAAACKTSTFRRDTCDCPRACTEESGCGDNGICHMTSATEGACYCKDGYTGDLCQYAPGDAPGGKGAATTAAPPAQIDASPVSSPLALLLTSFVVAVGMLAAQSV